MQLLCEFYKVDFDDTQGFIDLLENNDAFANAVVSLSKDPCVMEKILDSEGTLFQLLLPDISIYKQR